MAGGRFVKGEHRTGRAAGTPNKDKAAFAERLQALGCDPVKLNALYALGDVVALGLMTQEELDAEGDIIHTERGVTVIPSGHEKALEMLPSGVRQHAAETLLDRMQPKLKSVEHSGEIKTAPTLTVVLHKPAK